MNRIGCCEGAPMPRPKVMPIKQDKKPKKPIKKAN